MSTVPLSETAAKRRIGDILLDHGFVTADEIADATVEQESTGQPLGQILVGRGSITRLELASALAEQWSDPAASITAASRSAPAPASVPSAQDEAQYAARLQEAVADLARKVQSNKPLEGLDDRVDELSRRIEATLARTQHIEAAVATLAESLEGVTTGVEEAFYALQTGTAELVGDLARIEQTVGELAAREVSPGDGPSRADLEEVRAAVAELSGGARETAELRERLDGITARFESLAEPESAVEDVTRRVENVAALVDDLRTVVGELRARPAGTPELDSRLEHLEARLDESGGNGAELATRIDALADRLSEERGPDPRLEDALARITRLDALLERTTAHVDEMTATRGERDDAVVDGRLDDLAQTLDVLRGQITDVAASVGPDDASAERLLAVEARLDRVAQSNDETRALPGRLQALEETLAHRVVTPEALASALEELGNEREPDGHVSARLDVLEARTAEEFVTPAALSRALESHATDDLTRRFDALEARLADGLVTPEDLMRSIERARSERAAPVVDERVTGLTAELEALRAEVSSVVRQDDRRADTDRLSELEERIESLSQRPVDDDPLARRLEELESARRGDADTISVLAVAMDRIRHDLTTAEPSAQTETTAVLEAVAALSRRLDALENAPVAPAVPALNDSDVFSELERFRLVVERIGLHLGEHDRAIADLGPGRGVHERLHEITLLVQDLAEAQQNPPAPHAAGFVSPLPGDIGALLQRVEEAETTSQIDTEKLLSRLERMGASIDWRLQRLESDTAAAE